jgi:hypothetical protein
MALRLEAGMPISSNDLPVLYRDLDFTSNQAQVRYLRLVKWDLLALSLGALASSFSFDNTTWQRGLYIIAAILFFSSVVVTIVLLRRSYERAWYGGRAGAESVKTLAWRYMTRSKPFDELAESAADELFRVSLKEILESKRELAITRRDVRNAGQQITSTMRQVRGFDLGARKEVYRVQRIEDQCRWYSTRARENEDAERLWFWIVIGAQFVALVWALLQAVWPMIGVNLASVFAGVAAALIAWLQVKKHQELAQSYALAAHELGIIATKAKHVSTEEELSTFVADAEVAISREHTMWSARRDAVR